MCLILSLQRTAHISCHLYLLSDDFRICLFSISQACNATATWTRCSGSQISLLKQSLVHHPDFAWESCDFVLQRNTLEQNLCSVCLDLCFKKEKKSTCVSSLATEITCFIEEHQPIVINPWNASSLLPAQGKKCSGELLSLCEQVLLCQHVLSRALPLKSCWQTAQRALGRLSCSGPAQINKNN